MRKLYASSNASVVDMGNGTASGSVASDKRVKLIYIAIIVILLGVIVYFIVNNRRAQGASVIGSNMSIDTNAKQDVSVTEIPEQIVAYQGYEDMVVDADKSVSLYNDEANEGIFMKYSVLSDGVVIYETELIPSGQYVLWVPADYLDVGEHDVTFVQSPYKNVNGLYEEMTTASNSFKLTLV